MPLFDVSGIVNKLFENIWLIKLNAWCNDSALKKIQAKVVRKKVEKIFRPLLT
jgi:hypothetical protein